MADQHPHQGRRQHFHRGRRGQERRGDRRPNPASQGQGQSQESQSQPDQADVDQIIREIKSRISQRHGIDLSAQQIQELAARRLEAILDPRTVKPGLLDQLRKAAGAPADIAPAEAPDAFTFEDHTIYDTHNGLLRFLRKLFNPILKLFFNPNPIAAALNAQAKVNRDASRRESERERTQGEWNALHYTMLQRLVTEVSRVSLEIQSLALRVESLSTRADFTERRVRGLEAVPAPAAVPSRTFEPATPSAAPNPSPRPAGETASADGSSEGSRRRRRRRRGRRGTGPGGEVMGPGAALAPAQSDATEADDDAFDDGPEGDAGESGDGFESAEAAPEAPERPMSFGTAPQMSAAEPEPAPAAPAAAPEPAAIPADTPPAHDVTPPAAEPSET